MSRNRPADSSRRTQPDSSRKIDLPVLIVSALTVFFATLFATLLLLRPGSSDPRAPMPAGSDPVHAPPPVSAPPIELPQIDTSPVDLPQPDALPIDLPQVNAAPPERVLNAEPETHPILSPELRIQLEQLGVKCAEDANCYSD